ncbi:MAG: hypothetical protein U0132_07570 [Gemmatimonadaceae bacterium]
MEFTMKKFARLAALGALGVAVGSIGLYLVIAIGSSPARLGGIDRTQAIIAWIGAAVPIAAIAAAHLAYARQLFRYAKENG